METMDNDLPGEETSAETSDLRSEIEALRQQVWVMLVLMVVISGTLSTFLLVQMKNANKDLQENHQVVAQGAGMDQFLSRMVDYGKTHPDFVPILNKYGITVQNAPAPSPAAAPRK